MVFKVLFLLPCFLLPGLFAYPGVGIFPFLQQIRKLNMKQLNGNCFNPGLRPPGFLFLFSFLFFLMFLKNLVACLVLFSIRFGNGFVKTFVNPVIKTDRPQGGGGTVPFGWGWEPPSPASLAPPALCQASGSLPGSVAHSAAHYVSNSSFFTARRLSPPSVAQRTLYWACGPQI